MAATGTAGRSADRTVGKLMDGPLTGRVALVTGAARGQGRSHVLRLAEDGADIVAVDLCGEIDSVPYPLGTAEELAETAAAVRALGRRVVSRKADVRDAEALRRVVAESTAQLGPIGIVVANAGIASVGEAATSRAAFLDIVDVNLVGTWNTVMAAAPGMRSAGHGGAIVLISSTQGLKGTGGDGSPGITGYTAAKHGVVGLMRSFAHWLAPDRIRVNTVHPTGVDTPMIGNEAVRRHFAAQPEATANLLPVPLIGPEDVSDAVAWLVSEHAKYVTGIVLPVDAGASAR